MIILIHGDNTVESRRRLTDLKTEANLPAGKAGGKEIITLDAGKSTQTDLVQALESTTLFGTDRLVIIENIGAINLRSKDGEKTIDYLTQTTFDNDIIFWDGKVSGTALTNRVKKSKGSTIELFKQPAVIFNLLDAIKPNNATAMLVYLSECLRLSEAELIFYMIVRQVRLLLGMLTNANISEMKRVAPWQAGKLRKQALLFSESKLLQLYKELLIIDYQIKTGRSALDLTKRMQLVMMNL